MRNELEHIERIEKYLRGELSAQEKASFEEQLRTDVNLQKEVELQKDVVKGIERLAVKQTIQQSYKNYKLGKTGLNFGLGVIVLTAIFSTFLWFNGNLETIDTSKNLYAALNENGENMWADADKNLPSQLFTINTSIDTVIETKGGIVMYIPKESFLDDKGNTINGNVEFEVKEALNAAQIIQGGLSSKSGDRLLESAGMFYVNARKDGETVQINPDNGIYTEVPTDKVNPNMQLFEGKRMDDGSIDWINPTPLEKFLTPVDINSLNFYPPKYENKLAELKQSVSNKKYKDSLYYSFAWEDGKNNNNCLKIKQIHHGDGRYGGYKSSNRENIFLKGNNFDFFWTQEEIGCNEFDIIAVIGTSDSASINNFQIVEDNNSKYELLGQFKISNSFNSLKKKNLLNTKQLKNATVLTQRIKVKKEGDFGIKLNLKTSLLGQTVNYQEFISVVIVTEKPKSNACNGPIVKFIESDTVVSEIDSMPESTNLQQVCGINPAKIKAIWSDEFNITLIATREFEERLPSIFGTCNDKVLDLYINNINLDMYVIDSMAANITSGQRREEFLLFASRKDGKVKIDYNRVRKLQKHYEQKQKLIAEAIAKTKNKFEKEQKKLDAEIYKNRNSYTQDEFKRWQDNFNKEYEINLTEAYRQLGKEKPAPVPLTSGYKTIITTVGWKNIDQFVFASTNNRETLDYTDPETGKKAVIKYESITISIKDEVKFDRLLIYVLPDKLNSFMRMKKEKNKFTEKLNELMTHNLVCLGYIGEQAYFYSLDGIIPKEYTEIELMPLSQSELKHKLNRYDDTNRKSLLKDFDYQLFEVKEKVRQDKLAESKKFRDEIMTVIFPCGFDLIIREETILIE